ncbi:hypothetical protein ZIOFF_057607 [Zingiber officinale]|uniref:BHLH domain-containing protein n=1 Tax=Zingiber officinale TaxID=94328 RepID=A0A8J5F3V1_ZINOF|nr:hypothetical protein ZIOFF_057607 [Zingiber officinale]
MHEKGSPSKSKQQPLHDVLHMERNRREKMIEFYSALQSLVPNLLPKPTRTRIIDETISYIRSLEARIASLEARKATTIATVMAIEVQRSTTVDVVAVSGNASFFSMRFTSSRVGTVTELLRVFETHEAEVLCVTVVRNEGDATTNVTVTALVENAGAERIKRDLMKF